MPPPICPWPFLDPSVTSIISDDHRKEDLALVRQNVPLDEVVTEKDKPEGSDPGEPIANKDNEHIVVVDDVSDSGSDSPSKVGVEVQQDFKLKSNFWADEVDDDIEEGPTTEEEPFTEVVSKASKEKKKGTNKTTTPKKPANNCRSVAFKLSLGSKTSFFAAVYASTAYVKRRDLWSELTDLQQKHLGSWPFIGDFNSNVGAQEKRGGKMSCSIACEEFQAWMDVNNLIHLNINERISPGPIIEKAELVLIFSLIDRAIGNDICLLDWCDISVCILPRSKSEHHPLLMMLEQQDHTNLVLLNFSKFDLLIVTT
ncbi:hypothetical protein AAZX31_13G017400 [Glycine max]